MSVCDEGWGAIWKGEIGELDFCPCAITFAGAGMRVCGCTLGEWHEWLAEDSAQKASDSCPHSAALRAVLDDPTLVLVAVERGMTNCAKADLSIPGKCAPFADKCPCDKWEFEA